LRIVQQIWSLGEWRRNQISLALTAYLMAANVKERLDRDASRYTSLQRLAVTLFE